MAEKLQIERARLYKSTTVRSKYPCGICGTILATEFHHKKHLKTRHQPRDFICDYDGRHFNTKDKLRLHVFLHRKFYRVKCEVCHREYRTNQSMRKHLRTHFEKHQCDTCGQTFSHKRLLVNHISALHTDDPTIQCNCK